MSRGRVRASSISGPGLSCGSSPSEWRTRSTRFQATSGAGARTAQFHTALKRRGLGTAWETYEHAATEAALDAWAESHGLTFVGEMPDDDSRVIN